MTLHPNTFDKIVLSCSAAGAGIMAVIAAVAFLVIGEPTGAVVFAALAVIASVITNRVGPDLTR